MNGYSKVKPTMTGYYWWKRRINSTPDIVEVFKYEGEFLMSTVGGCSEPLRGYFNNRIKAPEEISRD